MVNLARRMRLGGEGEGGAGGGSQPDVHGPPRPPLCTDPSSSSEEPQRLARAPPPLQSPRAPPTAGLRGRGAETQSYRGERGGCAGPRALPGGRRRSGGRQLQAWREDAVALGPCAPAAAPLGGRWIRERGQVSGWRSPWLELPTGPLLFVPRPSWHPPRVCAC